LPLRDLVGSLANALVVVLLGLVAQTSLLDRHRTCSYRQAPP
jgi:hypothetical protein